MFGNDFEQGLGQGYYIRQQYYPGHQTWFERLFSWFRPRPTQYTPRFQYGGQQARQQMRGWMNW